MGLTITDHLNSGSARSATLSEAFREAATRGTTEQSDHPSHMDRQQGNGAVLNKLMTTRYPSSALVMELAAVMSQSPGRMDTERVQPGSRRFGQRRFKPVQSRTTVANRAARLEVARLGQSMRNGFPLRKGITVLSREVYFQTEPRNRNAAGGRIV